MNGLVQQEQSLGWSKFEKNRMEPRFRIVLILFIIIGRGYSDESTPHCDATTLTGTMISRSKLNVWKVNATPFEEPMLESQRIDICLSQGSLRLNWTMDPVQENQVKLCYDVKRIRNMNSLVTNCFMVDIPRLDHKTQLFCWFRMDTIEKEPYIHALVTQQTRNSINHYYEYMYVVHRDETKNCDHDICTDLAVQLGHKVFTCGGANRIHHEEGVSVEQLTFNATNSTQCQNVKVVFSKVTNQDIEFTVNCTYDGLGRIYVLYRIRERYCNPKYFVVRVSCESGAFSQSTLSIPPEPAFNELNLAVAFTVSSLIAVSVSITVLIAVKRIRKRGRHRNLSRQALNNRNETRHLNVENDADAVDEPFSRTK